nr:hypothetical protein [Tanacetum cinerariifolium]
MPPVNDGQRRRPPINGDGHDGDGGQRWRSMTVASGGPPLTAAGPPLTTIGPPVNDGWWAGQSWVWAGSKLGEITSFSDDQCLSSSNALAHHCLEYKVQTGGPYSYIYKLDYINLYGFFLNRTMDTTIDQQVARDEALVPHDKRLRIGRSNFRLLSNIKSKESTLQLVYDVLRLTTFFKAFLVIANVLEIYMQEFWATTNVHHHSIQFKMDNKKHIVNLESFREMLHICPRLPGQAFVKPTFEEEILSFLCFLGHSGAIRKLTDVNINKLHQPWRSFATIINKCLTEKSSGYDSLRLSQAQILWGLYHKRNVDFAYLMWEYFVYLVEHKDTKKSNEMYYPRFTKVIIHHFISKGPFILRRNKVNLHYVRDDHMFTMIKLVSRYQNTQQSYTPKPKASVRKTRSSSDTTITPPTAAAGPRLASSKKGKQAAKASNVKSLYALSKNFHDEEGDDDEGKDSDGDDEGNNGDDGEEGDDDDEENNEDHEEEGSDDEQAPDEEEFFHPSLSTHAEEETKDDESFDPISKTPKNSDDEGNSKENLRTNVGRDKGQDEEDEADELYRDVNINLGKGIKLGDVYTTQEVNDSHVTLTPVNPDGQQQSSSMSSIFVTSMLNPTPDAGMESIFETTLQMDVQTPTSVAPLPVFVATITPSTIAPVTTIQQTQTLPTTAPSTLLQDLHNFGSLFGFDHRLKTLEANFSKFTQTNQFARAVSSILGIVHRYMDQRMNKAVKVAVQLQFDRLREEAQKENDEFLKTIDENMQKIIKEQTSYAVAADLTEMELKKILIEKMEGNKSIHRSNEQRNLYKALVEAYESDKIIIGKYGDTITLKRRRDDDVDKDEEPSAGSDRGSKRRKEGKEPESASAPKGKATRSAGKSTQGLVEVEFLLEEVYKAITDQLDWVNPEGQQYSHNLLKPLPLIPNNQGHHVIAFDHFINNDLEYLRGGASSRKYTTSITKTKAADYGYIKWIEDLFYGFAVNRESAHDVYSKHRIIAVTELKIVEWHNYKHLDWITVRRDDDKLYKFKEGDFKRLRIQDIKDIIVIQRRVEDLQLGVESYQKKLNLTRPDTYCSDLKHKEAYSAYSNPRGFIYQNKDMQNRLMQIDELHKFSDEGLTDVRTALDDCLKGI